MGLPICAYIKSLSLHLFGSHYYLPEAGQLMLQNYKNYIPLSYAPLLTEVAVFHTGEPNPWALDQAPQGKLLLDHT